MWNRVDIDQIRSALGDYDLLDIIINCESTDINCILNECTLDQIETIASDQGWLSSEEQVSEFFDNIIDSLDELDRLKLIDDYIALDQDFSSFIDSLCKDGEIYTTQYENYDYIGKYS